MSRPEWLKIILVHSFLEESAARHPDRPAVWYRGKWMTFGEIDHRANQLANFLVEQGVRRGDRVAILWENAFDYVIAYYGVLKAGGVTVEINTEIVAEDLIYLLNDSGAKALIVQKRFLPLLKGNLKQAGQLQAVITDGAAEEVSALSSDTPAYALEEVYASASASPPNVRIIDIDLASIVYTSGSTGKPKGVMLTHLNIVTNTRSIVQYLDLTEADRIMVVLPFFYVYGKTLLNTHFAVGGSVVIDNRFVFPNAVLETMQKTECTGFAGVPSTFSILLSKSAVRKYSFPKLRYLTQAGGAMAPAVQKEVVQVFYPAKLFIMYGATEASARLSYLDPEELPRHWGSIGKAIPNVDLYVADEQGNPLPPGEVGEIVARGANIMQGYWNDPEETARALRNGLYFTGDLGKVDEDGYIYVVGRSKDMIKAGANRVSAKEIEEKLLEHEGVFEVAVVGVPDEILGEAIKAFVVPQPNGRPLTPDELLSFCKRKLPSFKVPKYIEFLDALPKNASGKILKHKLSQP